MARKLDGKQKKIVIGARVQPCDLERIIKEFGSFTEMVNSTLRGEPSNNAANFKALSFDGDLARIKRGNGKFERMVKITISNDSSISRYNAERIVEDIIQYMFNSEHEDIFDNLKCYSDIAKNIRKVRKEEYLDDSPF